MNRVLFILFIFLGSCTYCTYSKKAAVNLSSPHPNGRGKFKNVPIVKEGRKVFIKR